MTARTIYLASTSPRRRQLLAEAGIRFTLFPVPIDEDALSAEYIGPLDHLGEYLAREKAVAAVTHLRDAGEDGIVLAADTTVLLDGKSLAKPLDTEDAISMLRSLRGREHVVATGVAVAPTDWRTVLSATAATRVRMRDYSDDEVEQYVATGDPLDKAGSYSIQHPSFMPVESLAGCHLGVIGLPICLVTLLLAQVKLGAPHLPNSHASPPCPWSPLCRPPFPPSDGIHVVDVRRTSSP